MARSRRLHLAWVSLLAAGASLLAAAPGLALASSSEFVGSSGAGLTLHGHPWRFIGFNDYQLTSMPGGAYFCGRPIDDKTLGSVLQDAGPVG